MECSIKIENSVLRKQNSKPELSKTQLSAPQYESDYSPVHLSASSYLFLYLR